MTSRDEGVTLIEVLVGMGLFAVLSALLLGMALSTSKITEDTRHISELNEDSQLTMERITRELRQASSVESLHVSTGPTDPTVIEFVVDFDGVRLDSAGVDSSTPPETVTYSWNPAEETLTISEAGQSGTLAEHVSDFVVTVGSTLWQYDANRNGMTTWLELDAHGPPVGNQNSVLDGGADGELGHVDYLEIVMKTTNGTHVRKFATDVDLRNVDPNP